MLPPSDVGRTLPPLLALRLQRARRQLSEAKLHFAVSSQPTEAHKQIAQDHHLEDPGSPVQDLHGFSPICHVPFLHHLDQRQLHLTDYWR